MILDDIVERTRARLAAAPLDRDDLMGRATLAARQHEPHAFSRALAQKGISVIAEIKSASPSAGTIVFPRIAGTPDATAFVERVMRDQHTALAPGSFFEAPAHFRLGCGGDTDRLREGLARVAACL